MADARGPSGSAAAVLPRRPAPGPRGALLDDAADALLAERAADGDVRAFTVLVRRYGPALRAYAGRLLGSAAESDDVVQDTFITAWARLGDLGDPAAVRGWLFRIAGHNAIDRLRAHREHADVTEEDPAASDLHSPARSAEAGSLTAALAQALEALPPEQQRAWVLREMGGLHYDEIAAELALPASTVRGLLVRARRTLAERLEAWR